MWGPVLPFGLPGRERVSTLTVGEKEDNATIVTSASLQRVFKTLDKKRENQSDRI